MFFGIFEVLQTDLEQTSRIFKRKTRKRFVKTQKGNEGLKTWTLKTFGKISSGNEQIESHNRILEEKNRRTERKNQ